MTSRKTIVLILILGMAAACSLMKKNKSPQSIEIGFYNVENFFDTIDAPDKEDEFFLPSGPTEWNDWRYKKKLVQVLRVYNEMGRPELFGLSEVENASVLQDLAGKFNNELNIIHFESPDHRGIDVGLMYSSRVFELEEKAYIRISFPDSIVEDYTTRDILHAHLKTVNGQQLHVFVNHWPSRRGGLEASSPKREHVANTLRDYMTANNLDPSREAILLMGDFNDEPSNKSISENLGAGQLGEQHLFYSLMHSIEKDGKGSYNYRGQWNALDQFIVSSSLINGEKSDLEITEPEVFKREFMIYRDEKYGEKPNRTYGGPNYYGGISDHYPVRAMLYY
jgi:predicted extracellular nuclease